MDISDLREMRLHSRLSTDEAAKLMGVSRRTWQRWESSGNPPKHIIYLMRYRLGILPGWFGFRVHENGTITTPAGDTVHKNQIDQFYWLTSLLLDGQRDNQKLIDIVYPILQISGV